MVDYSVPKLDKVSAEFFASELFKAVIVDGVHYWDGEYLANPPIFPLFHATHSFHSSLASEFRAVEFVARLIDHGRLKRGTAPGEYRRINAHRIVLGENQKPYSADTKLSADYDFFRMLHASGRSAARRFLDEHSTTSASAARLICARRPKLSGREWACHDKEGDHSNCDGRKWSRDTQHGAGPRGGLNPGFALWAPRMHDDHIGGSLAPSPAFGPEIERIVQVD
jgi:hypothetical protein